MELSRDDFEALRRYIHAAVGISLGDDKEYLVRQRLAPVAAAFGCADFHAFCARLAAGPSPALRDAVISAITTNETSFFRDGHPFDALRTLILPWLSQLAVARRSAEPLRQGPRVSILSAGASTGQEPYSVAMTAMDYARATGFSGLRPEDLRITAVDVSQPVLERAQAGIFTAAEMARGLSVAQRDAHFRPHGSDFAVRDEVRRMIDFRRVNLISATWAPGTFDVVWCRNVLIYFDLPTKRRILKQLCEALTPGGFLILGATENLYGLAEGLESVHVAGAIVYRTSARPASAGEGQR